MFAKIVRWVWVDRVAIILGTFMGMLGVTYILSLTPPFEVVEKTAQPVIVRAGDTVNICRTVDYKYPTDVSIRRSLVRWDEELRTERVLDIPNSVENIPREVGFISICRDVVIPAGATVSTDWVLKTYATVKTSPFWVRTFEILPLKVEVIK